MTSETIPIETDLGVDSFLVEALNRYVLHGIMPGSFLTAVLENDLMRAMACADEYNKRHIFELCQYIFNHLPSSCHGSPAKVDAYLKEIRK